ncbi:unnamed protein product [Mytilus edulis]|uniref:CCHC-type domain-containing protein n=1 Tax=Mytilus edulis TaxID=6550 RepID=A0A8S3UGT6_MYTED|nr:unnamed protein product [Mytilus edulis]
MSSPEIGFSSADNNNTAESTFLYQKEDDFYSTILTPDFLEFNEFKEHDIFLSLPTPKKSSTLKLHSTHLDSSPQTQLSKWKNLPTVQHFRRYGYDGGQIFNTLKLGKSQQLEDFHSQILEKGNLLHKPDHEVLARFIEGLPEKMAFFVRAGQPADLSAALTSAKMAETWISLTSAINQISTSKHDDVNNFTSQPTKHDSEVNKSSEFGSLTNEVAKLSKNVSELLISKVPQASANSQYESPQNNFQRRQQYQYPNTNTNSNCFNCNFPGHRKRECNWNGFGQTTSSKCQICHQTGHTAYRCKTIKPNQENYQYPVDTRPNRSGP